MFSRRNLLFSGVAAALAICGLKTKKPRPDLWRMVERLSHVPGRLVWSDFPKVDALVSSWIVFGNGKTFCLDSSMEQMRDSCAKHYGPKVPITMESVTQVPGKRTTLVAYPEGTPRDQLRAYSEGWAYCEQTPSDYAREAFADCWDLSQGIRDKSQV